MYRHWNDSEMSTLIATQSCFTNHEAFHLLLGEQKAVKAPVSYALDGQHLASVAVPGTGAVHCGWPRVEVEILKTIWY